MQIKHYVEISTLSDNFFPDVNCFSLPSNDIKDIAIPQNAIKVVTYNRLSDKMVYKDKSYPVFSSKIDIKTYHIGKFVDIKEYLDKGDFYKALAQNGCTGMVITKNGVDNIVQAGDFVIDPKQINKDGYFKNKNGLKSSAHQAATPKNTSPTAQADNNEM